MLRELIAANRLEILARARLRVTSRNEPVLTGTELSEGLPAFLDQLCDALRKVSSNEALDHSDIEGTAGKHGLDQFRQGLSIAQVVHGYGDLCQVITGLAVDRDAAVGVDEFQTLNLCLDDAIAGAVTAYEHHRGRAIADERTERLGMMAHEMRNVLSTAILSFGSIRKGTVAAGGSTGANLERSLLRLGMLIERSFADVRLDAGVHPLERVPVWEVIEEVEIGARVFAETRGVHLVVASGEHTVIVEADRQILASAIANLVQDALKFTRPGATVRLRASATTSRVLVEIEDACGGLPPGGAESLLKPPAQRGDHWPGLGLGLSICLKAMKALSGELRVRDLPGEGCILTIDLPRP